MKKKSHMFRDKRVKFPINASLCISKWALKKTNNNKQTNKQKQEDKTAFSQFSISQFLFSILERYCRTFPA